MSIVITGATGQLGRLVVEQLLAAGTPPDTIVAVALSCVSSADLFTPEATEAFAI